jgi:hypothetical protein
VKIVHLDTQFGNGCKTRRAHEGAASSSPESSLTTCSGKLGAFHRGRGRWGAAAPYIDASFASSGAWRRTRGLGNWARWSRGSAQQCLTRTRGRPIEQRCALGIPLALRTLQALMSATFLWPVRPSSTSVYGLAHDSFVVTVWACRQMTEHR